MAINNISGRVIQPEAARKMADFLRQCVRIAQESALNLEADERVRYGSINERNKLLVYKGMDYHDRQPDLDSPDVDWEVMEQRLTARKELEGLEEMMDTLRELLSDQRIAHDFYLYQNTLTDYEYARYKAARSATGGWQAKVEDLKQFFPNTGGGGSNTNDNPNSNNPA